MAFSPRIACLSYGKPIEISFRDLVFGASLRLARSDTRPE
ncbi:hypothetical protein SNOG_00013 [Parastagonospora nodorum SN15]|uniref:Uncharacterized protein n=1 Tax=Phaeosphaeria nodorum (strain SN15 / ATCC MYA-4574 / FGSC 10173) TaxID=321614 RepID=Q0V7K1_PHANO|nr:hypothetical protein SNOG_00013 [Parastagonospora nodorum SN15]EAT91508.1 hypothetical protein SNOG_00013 [Parastagonospora nodorum SN15]